MGSLSLVHWMIVLLVVMLLFGGGRVSGLMGDVAKGIKSFKKGLTEEDDDTTPAAKAAAKRIEQKGQTIDQNADVRDEQKLDS